MGSQWGTNNAISDLTEAGGWMLMDCDTSSSTQQVRAVCKSTDTESAGCTHITQGGADGTVVRLPESVRLSSICKPCVRG
jgi:hypothetical protein